MDKYVLGLWDQVKFNFFFIVGLIISVALLRMFLDASMIGIFLFVAAAISFRLLLFGERRPLMYLKALGTLAVLFVVIFLLTSFLGWLGLVLVVLGFIIYKLWRGWALFMRSTRKIESILFGKPLDKSEFKRGEKPSIYKEKDSEDEDE